MSQTAGVWQSPFVHQGRHHCAVNEIGPWSHPLPAASEAEIDRHFPDGMCSSRNGDQFANDTLKSSLLPRIVRVFASVNACLIAESPDQERLVRTVIVDLSPMACVLSRKKLRNFSKSCLFASAVCSEPARPSIVM